MPQGGVWIPKLQTWETWEMEFTSHGIPGCFGLGEMLKMILFQPFHGQGHLPQSLTHPVRFSGWISALFAAKEIPSVVKQLPNGMWRGEKWKGAARGAVGQPRCVCPACGDNSSGPGLSVTLRSADFVLPPSPGGSWSRAGEGRGTVPPTEAPLSFPCTFPLLSLWILTSSTPASTPLPIQLDFNSTSTPLWLLCSAPGLRLHQWVWGSFHLHEDKKTIKIDYFSLQNFRNPLKTQTETLILNPS